MLPRRPIRRRRLVHLLGKGVHGGLGGHTLPDSSAAFQQVICPWRPAGKTALSLRLSAPAAAAWGLGRAPFSGRLHPVWKLRAGLPRPGHPILRKRRRTAGQHTLYSTRNKGVHAMREMSRGLSQRRVAANAGGGGEDGQGCTRPQFLLPLGRSGHLRGLCFSLSAWGKGDPLFLRQHLPARRRAGLCGLRYVHGGLPPSRKGGAHRAQCCSKRR